jgi:hypothetical protein
MSEMLIEEPDAITSAETKIELIRQQIGLMGANDYEIPAIDDLIARLKAGECAPEDAVEEAQAILSSKQDYH